MSKQDVAEPVEALGDIPAVLAEAAPQDKFQLYSQLGLHLTYEPARRLARAETGIGPRIWAPARTASAEAPSWQGWVATVCPAGRGISRSWCVRCAGPF